MELDEFKKKYKIHGNVDKFLKKYRNIVEENSANIRKNVKNFSIPQLNATLFILRAKGGKDEFIDTFSDVIGLVCIKNQSSASDILDNTKIISPEQKQQILDASQVYKDLLNDYKNSIAEVTKTEIALKNAKDERDKARIKASKLALAKNEETFEEYRKKVDDLFGTDFENEMRNEAIDKANSMNFSAEEIENSVPSVEEYSFEEPSIGENQYEAVQNDENNEIFENENNEANPITVEEEPIVEEIKEEYTEPQEVEEYSYEEPAEYTTPIEEEPVIEEIKEEVKEEPVVEVKVEQEIPESHLLFCTISLPQFKEFNNTERKKKKYANLSEEEMQEKYYNDEAKKTKNSKAQFDYDQKINAIEIYLDETKKNEVHAFCEYKTNTGFGIFSKRILKENKELPVELVEAMYYIQERDKQFTPNRSEDYTTEAKLAFERDLSSALAPKPEKIEESEIEEYVEPQEVEEVTVEEIQPVAEEYEDVDINLDDIPEYNGAETIEEEQVEPSITEQVEEAQEVEEYVEPQEVEEYSYEEPAEYTAPVEEEPVVEEPVVEEIKEEPKVEQKEEYVPFMPESYAKVPDYVEFSNNNDKAFIDFIKMTSFRTTEEAQQAFYGAYLKLKAENPKAVDKKIIKQILKDTKVSLEFDQDNPFDNEKADVKGKIVSKINIENEEVEEPAVEPVEIPVEENKIDEKLAEEVSDDDLLAILEGSKKVEDLYPDMSTDDLLDAVMNGTLDLDNESK